MLSNNANLMITGGTYTVITSGPRGLDLLQHHITLGAVHDSGERFNPPRCHAETRVALLAEIMEWVLEHQHRTSSSILWVHGPAGFGKSAIAQSIAEQCQALGLLAASFFFSREAAGRSHGKHLIATIAYQLALALPEVRPLIEQAIERDPSFFGRSLQTQFQNLVVEPLLSSTTQVGPAFILKPNLVLIDALDECRDPKVQCYIVSLINEGLQQHKNLPLKFIITSRPESHIRTAFEIGNIDRISSRISLQDYFGLHDDVQVFLRIKFEEIKQTHPLCAFISASWPALEVVRDLVRRSSGEIKYAAVVMEYISSPHHRPTERLDVILGLSDAGGDAPFSEFDRVYKNVFASVPNVQAALRILSVIIVMEVKMAPRMIERLMFLQPGDIELSLNELRSVVAFEGDQQSIRVHESLAQFLLDASRSGELCADQGKAHAELARNCLRHLQTNKLPLLTEYACYNFDSHFERATATKELHDEIMNFDLIALYRVTGGITSNFPSNGLHLSLEDLWFFVPAFFDCIQNFAGFKDADAIHDHHRTIFNEYLDAILERYHVDERLVDLVTLLTVHLSSATFQSLDDVPMCKDDLLDLKDAEHLMLVDENGLNTRHIVRRHSQTEPYIALLCDYLEDPEQSGKYFIDGERYACAAVRCLKFVCKSDVKVVMKAYIWSLECIPFLLLKAAHSTAVMSLLVNKGWDHIVRSFNSITAFPVFARMVKEARLAYLISFHLFVSNPSWLHAYPTYGIGRTTANIVYLELGSLTGCSPRSPTTPAFFVPQTKLQKLRRAPADNGLRRRQKAQIGPSRVIPVEDPFPDPDSDVRSVVTQVSILGVIKILCYRLWTQLL
ncbi:hypothetical protein B0H34DRAFT_801828 [Crassisporium funariophilum]|nr:hypothetical protein B0H34DRAFT_801828 [Crassisporium funariophilum]